MNLYAHAALYKKKYFLMINNKRKLKMNPIDRRRFLKAISLTGVGTLLAITGERNLTASVHEQVPTRPFGRTGVNVSILGLGGSQDLVSKQLLLRQAVKMGVTYWDTAYSYNNSETSMGQYLENYPEDRKKIFLVTKSHSSNPSELEDSLNTSLQRLQTPYVDMFFIHGVSNANNALTADVKKWVEKEKRKGRMHFFGFSSHKNMAACLEVASKLGWIDGIMTSYNYRLIQQDVMKRAVEACAEKGIGLVAMKTQAPMLAKLWADMGTENKTSEILTDHFIKKGYTIEQAKLKAVWENSPISCICSEMKNITILKANAAAAMDKAKIGATGKSLLDLHAKQTVSYYCSGCSEYCESMADNTIPISDIIRCVMYAHEYDESDRARYILKQLPECVLNRMENANFIPAENSCPNKMPIAKIMKAASKLLA